MSGISGTGDRSTDDAGSFEFVDLGAGEPEVEQEFVVVFAEQRRGALVEPVGAA